jgi:hypothetical protein
MNKSRKIGFTFCQIRDNCSTYAHAIFTLCPLGNRFGSSPELEIKFQTDNEAPSRKCSENESLWYGHHITVKGDYSEEMTPLLRILAKLEKSLQDRNEPDSTGETPFHLRKFTPENLVWAMAQAKIPFAVYDCRVSEIVPVSDVADLEMSKWHNKWESVLARDEKEAQKLMVRQMANSHYVSPTELQSWLNEGMQVKQDSYSRAPYANELAVNLVSPFA